MYPLETINVFWIMLNSSHVVILPNHSSYLLGEYKALSSKVFGTTYSVPSLVHRLLCLMEKYFAFLPHFQKFVL